MLTQGPKSDPKSKLIISPFPAFPGLLDIFIFTRNAMSIVLLFQLMGDGLGWSRLIYISMWVGGQGVGMIL